MPVAAWCAQAEGARGDGEAAAAALHSSEQAYGPQVAVFLPELELARAWERAAVGQTTAARMHAMCAAQIAHQAKQGAIATDSQEKVDLVTELIHGQALETD